MDNAVIASDGPDVKYDDNFSPTQPYSPSGNESGNDETAIITDEIENNKDVALIEGSFDVSKIGWKDINHKTQRMQDTKLDIYVNTLANTAMFILSTYIILKRKGTKQQVNLLIPPERINTITKFSSGGRSTASNNDYALHFSLTEGPEFVSPRDLHTDSTRATPEHLALIQSLAKVTELTFHLTSSYTITRKQKDFERLLAIFSLENTKNRPHKDKQYGNVNEGLPRAEASSPPRSPLANRNPKRRRRLTSNEHRQPNADNDAIFELQALISGIQTRLDNLEGRRRLSSNERRRPNRDDTIPKLRASISDILTRLDNLETQDLEEKHTLASNKRRRRNLDDDDIRLLQSSVSGIHTRLDDLAKQFKTRLDDLENQSKTRLDDLENQFKARFDDFAHQFLEEKRRLTSNELQRPIFHDDDIRRLQSSIGDIHIRVDDFATQIKTRLDDLEEQIKNTQLNQDAVYTPCQYDSDEKEAILQAVHDALEEFYLEFKWHLSDAIEDLERERKKGETSIREESKEAAAKFRDSVTDTATDTITRFRKALLDASDALKFPGP